MLTNRLIIARTTVAGVTVAGLLALSGCGSTVGPPEPTAPSVQTGRSNEAPDSSAAKAAAARTAASKEAEKKAAKEKAAAASRSTAQAATDRLAGAEQRAADIQDAASAAGWTGPICSPDTNLHRERAGQEALTDDALAAQCEAQVADAESLIAGAAADVPAASTEFPDPDDRRAHVKQILGLNREPTSGEMQLVNGCEANRTGDARSHAIWDETCANAGL